MARFHDLIAEYLASDPEGRPDNIYDDLTAEYDTLFDGGIADRDAHTAAVEALQAEISQLKAKNYDLLMACGADVEPKADGEEAAEEEEEDSDAIDSLFSRD